MVEGSRGRVVFVSNPSVTLDKVVNLNKRGDHIRRKLVKV